ncbi:DUF5667 domain-containing protein [Streptomyces sp. GC420]|uniref:DUF5667 domain-containing protein n=1 Tax=Streptomyces sp. GC420 TaxID=2697568 RepID=UPI0014151EDD|nr:DUF5667 domain-containing protein [Streptomyces sp. GC420]NBM18572.1 hypothetical protein [Streptomyces sp. GC420]
MIANVSAHRRANAFAQALEDEALQDTSARQPEQAAGDQGSGRTSAEQAERTRLLALARGLGELPPPQLDPEVKVVQRAQLVAAMEAMLAGGAIGDPQVPEQRTRKGAHRAAPLRRLRQGGAWSKLAAGGLTVGVAAGALGGVAAASSDALPGDSLYALKRGMEDLRLGMADDEDDRGRLYLDQASTRLGEARRLMERDRRGELDHETLGEVRRALSGMRHDAAEGHRLLHDAFEKNGSLAPIQALTAFSDSHRDPWSRLRERLPAQLADVGNEVNEVFEAIEQEVEPLRSMLPGEGSPGSDQASQQPGGAEDGSGSVTSPDDPAASSPAVSQGAGTTGGSTKPGGSGRGSGAEEDTEDDGGLLGGSDGGGLLDPPAQTSPSPSGSTSTSEPDITLPPLLPGILPGLGIDGEDVD